MLPTRIARLLALGAFGATGGLLLLLALVVWITIPRPTGGMDQTLAIVTWIACGGAILGLVALHLVLAKRLWENKPEH